MVKNTIAILGATERCGVEVAKNLAKDNFRLLFFGHNNTQLTALAEEIQFLEPHADICCLDCLVDASWEADIIISALPTCSETDVARKIREVVTQKILLILVDRVDEMEVGSRLETDPTEMKQLMPNTRIIKTSSSQFAADIARAVASGRSIDSLIGDYNSQIPRL